MVDIFNFLADLRENNNRDWFNQHKDRYLSSKEKFDLLIQNVIDGLAVKDKSFEFLTAKQCVYRIYRDARFSANKQPYKTHFGASINPGGRKSGFAGYYLHISPEQIMMGGGIYKPEAKSLKAIRDHIFENPEEYKAILNGAAFKTLYPEVQGEKLKRAPKGFPKDFADLELIKNKSFFVVRHTEVIEDQSALEQEILQSFEIQAPFNKFLNQALENIENH